MAMLGYWSDPAAIDPAGWMHTGDLAVMDDELRGRVPRAHRDVQDSAVLEVRGRVPNDRDRQGAEVPDAGDRGGGAGWRRPNSLFWWRRSPHPPLRGDLPLKGGGQSNSLTSPLEGRLVGVVDAPVSLEVKAIL